MRRYRPREIHGILLVQRSKWHQSSVTGGLPNPSHGPLTASIKTHGALQPLLVQHRRDGYQTRGNLTELRRTASSGRAAADQNVPTHAGSTPVRGLRSEIHCELSSPGARRAVVGAVED
jgi:hypothetical protein